MLIQHYLLDAHTAMSLQILDTGVAASALGNLHRLITTTAMVSTACHTFAIVVPGTYLASAGINNIKCFLCCPTNKKHLGLIMLKLSRYQVPQWQMYDKQLTPWLLW